MIMNATDPLQDVIKEIAQSRSLSSAMSWTDGAAAGMGAGAADGVVMEDVLGEDKRPRINHKGKRETRDILVSGPRQKRTDHSANGLAVAKIPETSAFHEFRAPLPYT